jgi:putative membrane protein
MHNFGMNSMNMHGFGLIFWIIIIGMLIWFIYYFTSRENKNRTTESPLDILKKRYAKGEISKEEFEEKKIEIGK